MSKITFVLGAGASKDFGGSMPVGSELATRIQALLNDDFGSERLKGPISDSLRENLLTSKHKAAADRIRQSLQTKNSIDEFISEWSDIEHLSEIAKLSIAHCILEAESRTAISNISFSSSIQISTVLRSLNDTWIGILYRFVNQPAPRRRISEVFKDVSFITFNYDRCLERYLYNTFVSGAGLDPLSAEQALSKIPIFHAYGSLGPYPGRDAFSVSFGGIGSSLTGASSGIRTFNEEMHDEDLVDLRRVANSADQIIFLGFGFHEQNLRILFPDGAPMSAQIWGTVCDMRTRQINRVQQYFSAPGPHPTADRIFENLGAAEFMRKHYDAIFDVN